MLRAKYLRRPNLAGVASWLQENFPLSPALSRSLDKTLAALIERGALQGVRIEQEMPDGDVRLQGLGLSCFINPAIAARCFDAAIPFTFIWILEQLVTGHSHILDRPEIGRANASDGLALLVLYLQKGWDLTHPVWRQVGILGHQTFVRYHTGYNIRSCIHEDWSSHPSIYFAAGYQRSKTFPIDRKTLPKGAYCPADTRTILMATREEIAASAPGSTLSYIFDHKRPQCGFSAPEQEILIRGLESLTDTDIAAALNLPLTSVKHGWRQIYSKVETALPLVLSDANVVEGQRGPEKRRLVLAYVEEHPEELRPFER